MDERVLMQHLIREQGEVVGRDKIVGANLKIQV
jgi:hypothetical protein